MEYKNKKWALFRESKIMNMSGNITRVIKVQEIIVLIKLSFLLTKNDVLKL
jgi:hypothetical protein